MKKELVSEEQYTGDFNCILLFYNTLRKVTIARITVDNPYLSGEVDIQYLPDGIYDLVIGNVAGARSADDPDSGGERHERSLPGVELRRKESTNRLKLQAVQKVQWWVEKSL